MSKSGINALMRHVASRWGKEGIRSNAIAPGVVLTESSTVTMPQAMRDMILAMGRSPRLGCPDDIAAMVAMLFSDDGEWINGQVVSVDGGVTLR
jgi:NAD(P)-dependent dehydrogenase (short-subunit alcohol dehydrogenase family)